MNIRVADKHLGECLVKTNTDVTKAQEYTIKSLCMLQLMCMDDEEQNQEKFSQFIDTIKTAVDKINKIYDGENTITDDPTACFD